LKTRTVLANLPFGLHRYRYFLTFEQGLKLTKALAGVQTETIAPAWPGASVKSVTQVGGGAHGMTLEEFRSQILSLLDPNVRLVAPFQTSVLFAKEDRGPLDRMFRLAGAHWVALVTYLPDRDLILAADCSTLRSTGWLVSPEDLYRQVNTRCCCTGRYRGLLRLQL